jgi:hypothetical protein
MLVPVTQLIGTLSSSRTLSTPMCARPRAPPPESARPMLRFDGEGEGGAVAGDAGWAMGVGSAAKACELDARHGKAIAAASAPAVIRDGTIIEISPLTRREPRASLKKRAVTKNATDHRNCNRERRAAAC